MKKLAFFAVACLLGLPASMAENNYTIDASHADISFKVKHMLVSKTRGKFTEFDGGFQFDAASKTLKSANCTIKTESVDTSNEKRDKHLRNEDFFDVEKHPEMTFESTKVEKQDDGTYTVTGKFTLLGTTKEISFPAEVSGPVKDPWGNTRIGFEFETTIDRTEYGMDHSTKVVGKEVQISVSLEAIAEK